MTVNDNIRRIRLEKGMTQKQVAQACGTADAYIRAYELGKYNPKPSTVAKIAKALGVTPAELYGRDERGERDAYTEFAIYQAENGGEIDETAVNMQQLMATAAGLSHQGQEMLLNLAKEMSFVTSLNPSKTVAGALGNLTEEEQEQILTACHSLREMKLEKAMMEAKHCKSAAALRSNAVIMARDNGILADVILAALERAGFFNSDK